MPHAKDKSKCQHAQIELRSTFFVYFDVTTSGHTRTPLDLCHTRQIHTIRYHIAIPQSEIPCCLTRTLWILGIPDWETRNALGPDSRPPQQCGRKYKQAWKLSNFFSDIIYIMLLRWAGVVTSVE